MVGKDIPDAVRAIFAEKDMLKNLYPAIWKMIEPRAEAYKKEPLAAWVDAEVSLVMKTTYAEFMLKSLTMVYDEIIKDGLSDAQKMASIKSLLDERAPKTHELAEVSLSYRKGQNG